MSGLLYNSKVNQGEGGWLTREQLEHCGLQAETPPPKSNPRTIPAHIISGPGTELHKLLARLGFSEHIACNCAGRMLTMNQWGPEKCREEIDTIVGWLREEHGRRKVKIPFVPIVVRRIVMRAIKAARRLPD